MLDASGSYGPVFAVAGCAYLLALAALHIVSPRLAPARFDLEESIA